MFFGANQSGFTIGELLRLFCISLQDQIKHRTYFYKSATLVQEGMLVVNNSGLTGDPTSAKVEIDRRMLDFCVGLDTEFSEIVEGSHLYYPKTKFEQVSLVTLYVVLLGPPPSPLPISSHPSPPLIRSSWGRSRKVSYSAQSATLIASSVAGRRWVWMTPSPMGQGW